MKRVVIPVALVLALVMSASVAQEPPDMAPEAAAELRAAIDLLKQHHMNRDRLDWAAVEAKAFADAKGATTAEATYPRIHSIIVQLGEKHTALIPAETYKQQMSPQLAALTAYRPTGPEGMILAGGVGYLKLPNFTGAEAAQRAYVAAGRATLKNFQAKKLCRVIVDLRDNTGGNMYPMINAVASLLGPPPYGYWMPASGPKSPWTISDAPFIPSQREAIPPYTDPLPSQSDWPVAILIGGRTASAGEDTAIAFMGRKGARLFGQNSAGYLTTNVSYPLPDGGMLAISNGWLADRLGRSWREVLEPDAATPPGQETLDAAIAWLKAQRC
jgi:C-terminal processing protease CtpA/Prc